MSTVAQVLRAVAWRVGPRFMADRARRYEASLRDRAGVTGAARTHVLTRGETVSAGPFKGMRYPAELIAAADAPVAKLLGVYEQELEAELRSVMDRLSRTPEPCFLDLGSADGYYAVGMARAIPGLRVVAWDLARSARRTTARLAEANGVEIELRKGATSAELRELGPRAHVLLCDIEGAEVDVLTPSAVERLGQVTVIVEIHEGRSPGSERLLRERFEGSHDVRLVELRGREGEEPRGVSEQRASDLRWGIFTPRPVT